jgi:hypothetical protein
MRKALTALIAGGALAVAAAPAFAQYYDTSYGGGIDQREANMRLRINEGLRDGDLSVGQAAQLRNELRQIVNLDARYQDEGMTGWRVRDLNSRLSLLDSRLDYDLSMSGDYD